MSKSMENQNQKILCFHGASAWIVLFILIFGGIWLTLWLLRVFIQGPFYRKRNRIDGKVVIITECSSGMGKETALELARRGASIHMACKDEVSCEAARLDIIERTGNQNLYNRKLDLASLDSVRYFVERFLQEEERLDILINNANVVSTSRVMTSDGFEKQIGVNHLGHFLLTTMLLDRLKVSAPSRIVVLTSIFYIFGRINKDDLMSEKKYSKLFGAYSNSKLANLLFTRKLSEFLQRTGVTVNAAHPGIMRKELLPDDSCNRICSWFLEALLYCITKTPRAAAQTSIRLALDPSLERSNGHFYADTIRLPILPHAKDREIADWLWIESERLVDHKAQDNDDIHTVVINHF